LAHLCNGLVATVERATQERKLLAAESKKRPMN